jgi:SAM-dependent methyltransferase
MTDHLTENQRFWDAYAPKWIERGEAAWRAEQPYWGIWATPESELALIPSDLAGRSVVELGCGTGYVSRWFEQRGASVTAVDLSRQQLATAKRFAAQFQSEITFIQSNAEATPLPNRCADIVVSEYGAAIWCDPYRWIPEAARLLVPGGRLIFLGHSPWAMVCTDDDGEAVTNAMKRSYFELHRVDWTDAAIDPGGIEFNLPLSKWFRLFREQGFRLDDYLEIQAPMNKSPDQFSTPWEWARAYPSEQVFKLTKV